MTPANRKIEWLVWGGLLLVIATLVLVFLLREVRARNSLAKELPPLGTVADFTLTNQAGQTVTLDTLRGHVWVGDIIFTRCPGPCRKMTHEMNELSEALPVGSNARLVTLTTDPTYDTPPILRDYVQQLKLKTTPADRWLFLTGTKQQIAQLAVDSLKLTALEKPTGDRESANDLFIHSTIFVVVDKQGQLRAVFQSTGEGVDFQQVKGKILNTVRRLEGER
jgi:protein SCO1/2